MASPILSSPVNNAASTSPAHGGPSFDPAGAKNVGNGKGLQFIGGQCLSASDCASGCCAGPSGICSGLGAQTQNGKTGCGFGGGSSKGATKSKEVKSKKMKSTATAAAGIKAAASTSPAHGGPPFDSAGVKNVGNGKGLQFIGGQCLSASDCASGCCAGPSGICSGPGAQTQNGKTGCGFGGGGTTKAKKTKMTDEAAAAAATVITGKGDTFPCAKSSKSSSMDHNSKPSNSSTPSPINLNKPQSADAAPTPIPLTPKSTAQATGETPQSGSSSAGAPHIKLNRRERLERVSYVYLNNPVALGEGY